MRSAALLAWLLPFAALGHYFAFDFVTPSGVGTRTDGGFTAVQWVDGADPNGLAELTLYASRNGISPFVLAPKDVQFGPPAIPVNDPTNVAFWDARAVPPGCYQPFALMVDQIEGTTVRPSVGLITVGPLDGGNMPPAIWVLNQDFEKPPTDGGNFALRLKVDDPDDVGEVTLRWSDGADAGGTIVQGLPTSDGGGTLTYSFSPRALPPATVYYLHAEIRGFDGQRCDVWWGGYLPGSAAVDAGVDAGTDAGFEDAGVIDGGADGGGEILPPKGCGCSQSGAPLLVVAALVFAQRRRRLPV
jgi:uncharacterized protein (TIGR03382 family)